MDHTITKKVREEAHYRIEYETGCVDINVNPEDLIYTLSVWEHVEDSVNCRNPSQDMGGLSLDELKAIHALLGKVLKDAGEEGDDEDDKEGGDEEAFELPDNDPLADAICKRFCLDDDSVFVTLPYENERIIPIANLMVGDIFSGPDDVGQHYWIARRYVQVRHSMYVEATKHIHPPFLFVIGDEVSFNVVGSVQSAVHDLMGDPFWRTVYPDEVKAGDIIRHDPGNVCIKIDKVVPGVLAAQSPRVTGREVS